LAKNRGKMFGGLGGINRAKKLAKLKKTKVLL